MGKSLRSKSLRRNNAIKRERYGVKELARLKKTLARDKGADFDVEMLDPDLVKVTNAQKIKEDIKNKSMDTGGSSTFDPSTMMDKDGKHPQWMKSRAIKKSRSKRNKKEKIKKGKNRLAW